MRGVRFWVGKGASGAAASWAPAPSCRLNVHKTTLASTKLPSNWGSWELAVHRAVVVEVTFVDPSCWMLISRVLGWLVPCSVLNNG